VEVRLNGNLATSANFPTASFAVVGTNLSPYNTSTGILSQRTSAGTTIGASFAISNLPLGLYTVRLTRLASTGGMLLNGFDIITPIHAAGSSIPTDLQNSLPIGSLALADTRQFSAIKEASAQEKNVSQAVGIASNPTTTSTTLVPAPEMSVTHLSKTGKIRVSYSMSASHAGAASGVQTAIYVNGSPTPFAKGRISAIAGAYGVLSDDAVIAVSPGVIKIDLYWSSLGVGTSTASATWRRITVEDV
jgi:hypothetical protein